MPYSKTDILLIQDSILEKRFPPVYSEPSWQPGNWERGEVNCFAYAINSTYPCRQIYGVFGIKPISDLFKNGEEPTKALYDYIHPQKYTDEEILEAFENVMSELQIPFARTERYRKIPKNAYKIGVCNSIATRDFHFIKQNRDGIWSHKQGWFKAPEKICLGSENPEEYLEFYDYKVIAYYAVSKCEKTMSLTDILKIVNSSVEK